MVTIAQRMYIDGRWRDAEGDGVFDVVDPATRKMIERVPDASAADVRSAVDAADRAFPAWAATPAKERGRTLARIQARLESETEAIARLIVLENGKPFEEAKKEVAFALGYFGWFGEEARRLAGEWEPSPVPGKRLLVLRQPVGPVAASEFLNDRCIRTNGFTGSTEIGQWIMGRAAAQLKRLSFELGGNAPSIVFDDADFEPAVAAAVAIKFLRVGGQSCICANRIYVQTGIAARFVPAFTEAVKRVRVAPGFERGAEVGPLINEETRTKVHGLVEDAVGRGARALTGGRPLADGARADGFFYSPTVLTDVSDDMPVCREEIFGPVAPVLTFDTEEEVLRRANDTTFGLAAYFYTRDPARPLRVAEGLKYGLVGANDASGYTHEIPFGGFKASGLGREGGHQGIEEYTEVKSVVIGLG